MRKRFFSFKRLKRHRIHRIFKIFRLKKEIFRTKALTGLKLKTLINFNSTFLFSRLFLSNLSTKILLILTLFLSNKFKRFLPKTVKFLRLFYNFNVKNYFSTYLTTFKK